MRKEEVKNERLQRAQGIGGASKNSVYFSQFQPEMCQTLLAQINLFILVLSFFSNGVFLLK